VYESVHSLEAAKRRSTRIVQAVPLIVSGVDALGRLFQERTSTLVINCHGCHYQSTHYVLKNTWLTLQVPHSEPGRDSRRVRAQVVWIERPRTDRELFQVGAELEVPGNFWGIAFAPADWFPFPEIPPTQIPAPSEPELAEPAGSDAAAHAAPGGNVRTMLANGGADPALPLLIKRLANEARQQLQDTVRESAARAVSAETHPLINALQTQLKEAAEQSVEAAAATTTKQALRGRLAQTEGAMEEGLAALRERWGRELGQDIERAGQDFADHLRKIEGERRSAFERELDSLLRQALENLQRGSGDFNARFAGVEENLNQFRSQANETSTMAVQTLREQISAQYEKVRTELEELEHAAGQLNERLTSTAASAEAAWQARVNRDLDDAERRWTERVESSVEDAACRTAARVERDSQATAERLAGEIRTRLAAMSQTFAEAGSSAENKIEALRASLDTEARRAQEALSKAETIAKHVEAEVSRLATLAKATQQELERRVAALVETQGSEMARRAEQSIVTWTERLELRLEAAGQQAITRLGTELEQQFNSDFDHARQAMVQLDGATRSAEEALRRQEESVTKASEQTIETVVARVQAAMTRLEQDFEMSGRVATAKWIAEIEGNATETMHATSESLFKTADWYEKKMQTQMQSALERGMEQANSGLREKAGETSSLFATELDHYSRNYVEHTRDQFEESSREILDRVRQESTAVVASSAASLEQRAQTHGEAALGDLRVKFGAIFAQISAQMDARAAGGLAELNAEAESASEAFRSGLAQQNLQALDEARKELASHTEAGKAGLRVEAQAQENRLRGAMASLADEVMDLYKRRLDNASNSWMLTTASQLNQQLQGQIETLDRSAEQRLRDTCNRVFAGVGETLRQRMLDLLVAPADKMDASQQK
jgi:hypothetical protein